MVTVEHTIQVSQQDQRPLPFGPFRPDLLPAGTATSCLDANAAVVQGYPGKNFLAPGELVGNSRPLATVDCARLHDEGDALEHTDVLQWVTRHGDDVGVVARLEQADLVLPVE